MTDSNKTQQKLVNSIRKSRDTASAANRPAAAKSEAAAPAAPAAKPAAAKPAAAKPAPASVKEQVIEAAKADAPASNPFARRNRVWPD